MGRTWERAAVRGGEAPRAYPDDAAARAPPALLLVLVLVLLLEEVL